jgi:TetR/AcrR family transcriptional regulator
MARPRANDYDDKRLAILRSATLLLARHGYARTSMAEIADACGISKSLLYHYYSSKEGLLYDILERHLERLVRVVATAAVGAPGEAPAHRLERMVGDLLEAYRDADDLHKVQMNEFAILPDEAQARLSALERRIVAAFAAVLVEISPPLGEAGQPLKPVTMSLLGMINWHHTWFREHGPLSRRDYAALASRLIVAGVRDPQYLLREYPN